jgi:hypothetical protein
MQNLRRKPTYNELINYLEFEQPKIKYPNRIASFLRNSPYLSQFDGESWIDLEKQENDINKERMKEMEVRRRVREESSTAQTVRASLSRDASPRLSVSMMFDTNYDDDLDTFVDDLEEEEQRALEENIRRANEMYSMGSRAVGEASAQEERDYGFDIGTPHRPSAPPESTYGTPIEPRTLAEEFKTLEETDSAKKIQTAFRKKRADEARAKAIAKKKAEQDAQAQELFEQANKFKNEQATKIQVAYKGKKSRTRINKKTQANSAVKEIIGDIIDDSYDKIKFNENERRHKREIDELFAKEAAKEEAKKLKEQKKREKLDRAAVLAVAKAAAKSSASSSSNVAGLRGSEAKSLPTPPKKKTK